VSFRWVSKEVVLAIHKEQIAQHGGLDGIRDMGLLDSALARPLNLYSYGDPTLPICAASYAHGILRNHPFFDGNKRTAFIVAATFLLLNEYYINTPESNVAIVIAKCAAGDLSEDNLAHWFAETIIPIKE